MKKEIEQTTDALHAGVPKTTVDAYRAWLAAPEPLIEPRRSCPGAVLASTHGTTLMDIARLAGILAGVAP